MRRASPIRLLLVALAGVLPVSAFAEGECTAGKFCNLNSYLHGLYAIAAVLSVILIVVIAGTILYYRRAKNTRLEP